MPQFLLGLALFFGMHSISIVALPLRDQLAAKSEIGWKILYGSVSLIGIILISRGYVDLRQAPTLLYVSPIWLHHVVTILLLPTFILFLAPYFPGRINNTVKHPQLVAVMIWAVAHLLVNGTLADLLLFGSFLLWAIVDRISMMNRATRSVPSVPQSKANDIIVVVVGLAVYAAIVFWLHETLLGVKPLI
ncbi:NnrU family protein [Nitrosococcus oceani]|uniref:NnrU-like protein n=2 Tax=Nitrosococcus oceani TaxID=1229 RepID=Q3JDP5_NITOC|nr:NnrU family protein [Nitrosococcus oceani]ABA57051.1 NnrU-like protein [Nitrosococcus oceani ATCC 19707]KFI20520.1 NnrU family protein [Nitrosococcus oceani C-27]KFI23626.1 NnrU family protein [Nitrosococcus oceani]GEM19935.1 NnrU-like protein [Nitrosococcus oceani]